MDKEHKIGSITSEKQTYIVDMKQQIIASVNTSAYCTAREQLRDLINLYGNSIMTETNWDTDETTKQILVSMSIHLISVERDHNRNNGGLTI